MSWCVGQDVPVLHGIRFVDGSHEQHVVLCSTFDMCVRDWVLCSKYVVMRVRLLALRGDDCASEDVSLPFFEAQCRSNSCEGGLTRRHDDDNQQDDDADDDADAHLHILPPHLLAHAVGAAAEALRGRCQVVGFILQGVEALAALGGFAQVFLHLGHGTVDLLFVTKRTVSSVVLLMLRDWSCWLARDMLQVQVPWCSPAVSVPAHKSQKCHFAGGLTLVSSLLPALDAGASSCVLRSL